MSPALMAKPLGSPQSSASSKKRKTEELELSVKSQKRSRVSYSCGECHRRKQKCNRQTPCNHCLARKCPEICKAYSPGKSEQDIQQRISRIEHVLELALPQYWSGGGSTPGDGTGGERHRSVSTGPEDENMSGAEEQDPVGGTFQRGTWFGHAAAGAIASESMLEQLTSAVSSNAKSTPELRSAKPPDSRPKSTDRPASSTPVFSSVPEAERSATERLNALISECGVSPHKISELMSELPPRPFADSLVDYYFSTINWTRYPIPEADFRASYTSLCSSGVTAHPNDVRFLPLLFVVLAISVRLSPERLGGDAKTRRLTSLRYYWSSRRSLLIVAAIQPHCLEMIWTRLLSARFLTFDRRITECWSQLGAAVSTAQSLGLHRDGATMRMEPTQVENRRRIWSYLYHADRSFALVLGRPASIQDQYTSTQVPLNLEFDLPAKLVANPPPLTSPTPMTFVILRNALAVIMGGISHHFQQVNRQSHYSEVGKLDDDISHFIQNLPPQFAMDPDTSDDETHPYLPAHRFLLITEVLFVRTTLHRPYLLRKLDSDRYLRSRKVCFECALKDFQVRQGFRKQMSKEKRSAVAIGYREFQAAMISAIYLVLHPKSPDASQMRTIMDTFLREHEGDREMDDTTLREIKTIEFLRSKAAQLAEAPPTSSTADGRATFHGGNPGNGAHPEAHLLLGLQQSTPQTNNFTALPPFSLFDSPQPPTGVGAQLSPPNTGSPEDSTAQTLLDHWCNTVGPGSMDGAANGLSWGFPAEADSTRWSSTGPFLGMDSQVWDGTGTGASSDLSYWETLVDQIRGAPS